jgi:hypothetical protein
MNSIVFYGGYQDYCVSKDSEESSEREPSKDNILIIFVERGLLKGFEDSV